ncbi:hypothetical protein V5279_46015 (plasmid) [Bradyrhizobium sp. 26S5]|uniref:hypothetical protein n=1 Tax=Bradyrhizobium sp. 26S5 TaxID=3139729 RepID=UPI0030D37483
MSTPHKPTAHEELERIEDGLVDSILNASGDELRKEIAAAGGHPDAMVARIDSALASARAASARARLERARAELTAWRDNGSNVSTLEREAARKRLGHLQSGGGDPDKKFMMAARKGQGLSDQDIEGLIEDMVELERLERDGKE